MLDLKVQYFQDSPPAGRPYREEHFIRRHVQMELPVEQTALVPVLERARQTGLTIVHAPSPPVAEQFDQLKQHAPPLPVAIAGPGPGGSAISLRRRASSPKSKTGLGE